jgi:hypothetical protein
VTRKLVALGFSAGDAATLADHFLDAERRGRTGHGLSRVDWLATLPGLDGLRSSAPKAASSGGKAAARWAISCSPRSSGRNSRTRLTARA